MLWLFLVVVTGVVGVTLWFVLRARPNQGIELGTNRPYPDGYGSAEPPYLPTPVVSDAEEFRLHAEETLARQDHRRREHERARSWMDEPGALDRDGLYDSDDAHPAPEHPHVHRREHGSV